MTWWDGLTGFQQFLCWCGLALVIGTVLAVIFDGISLVWYEIGKWVAQASLALGGVFTVVYLFGSWVGCIGPKKVSEQHAQFEPKCVTQKLKSDGSGLWVCTEWYKMPESKGDTDVR